MEQWVEEGFWDWIRVCLRKARYVGYMQLSFKTILTMEDLRGVTNLLGERKELDCVIKSYKPRSKTVRIYSKV